MRVGGRVGFASVHVYEPARSAENIRPGQHIAIPVRLRGGEVRRWSIPASPEVIFVAMLRNHDAQPIPRLAIVGANCGRGLDADSFFCLARQDAAVIAYSPKEIDSAQELSGTLAIWRQEKP